MWQGEARIPMSAQGKEAVLPTIEGIKTSIKVLSTPRSKYKVAYKTRTEGVTERVMLRIYETGLSYINDYC